MSFYPVIFIINYHADLNSYLMDVHSPYPISGYLSWIGIIFLLVLGLILFLKMSKDYRRIKSVNNFRRDILDRTFLLLHNLPDFVLSITPNGKITYINKGFPNTAPEKIIGKNIKEFLDTSDFQTQINLIKNAINENKEIQTRIKFKSQIFETKIIPSVWSGKQEVLVILSDISTNLRLNTTLRDSIRQFRTLVKTLPGVAYRKTYDQSGQEKIVFISDGFLDLTGYSPGDVINGKLRWSDLVFEQDLPSVGKVIEMCNPSTPKYSVEYRIRHKNGKKVWVLNQAFSSFDQNGTLISRDGVILDITKEKKYEAEISTHQQELTLALEGADLGTWQCHIPTGNVIVNDRYLDMIGYTREEFINTFDFWRSLIHPQDLHLVEQEITQNLNGITKSVQVEHRIKHKKGHWVWILDKGKVVEWDILGSPVKSSGTFQDITDRKLQEQNFLHLNIELQQFKFALDATSIVSITDIKGCIKYVNEKFVEISGYSADEAIGSKHNLINSGVHPKSFWKALWSTIGQGLVWQGEVCNRAKNGTLYWVNTFIVPIKDENDKIKEYLSIRTDITERKRHEEKLAMLSLVASRTSNYVTFTDKHGKTLWVNESFEREIGYSLHEIVGKKPGDVLQGPDTDKTTVQLIRKKLAEKVPFSTEILNYSKEGKPYWVNINFQPIFDNNEELSQYFAIMRNITEHKDLVNSLQKALEDVKKADKLKSAFLANISHEIRTPMNAIMGFSELIANDNISEIKRKKFSKLIKIRSRELLRLINDTLDYSQIESGQIMLHYTKGNIGHLLDRIKESFIEDSEILEKTNVEIKCVNNLKKNEEWIQSDIIKIHQVMVNLISNAIKFTEQGYIEFGCFRMKEDVLKFYVKDTGIGIKKESLEEIFHPFNQGGNDVHLKYGGSGLGLSICKGFIELWGGEIYVTSKTNKGTTFEFTVPYQPVSAEIIN